MAIKSGVIRTTLENDVIEAMQVDEDDIRDRVIASFVQGTVLEKDETPDDVYFDETLVTNWLKKNYGEIRHLLTV